MTVSRISMGIAVLAISLFGLVRTSQADIIYDDLFDGTAAASINGRTPDTASGLDGGTAAATWTSGDTANIGTPSGATDALWTVSGGVNTGLGTTFANVTGATTTNGADDANQIGNAVLPFTPQAGFIYDLHMHSDSNTETPTLTGNWLGLAFLSANLNGHNSWGQAISNDLFTGLMLIKGTGAVQGFHGTTTGAGQEVNLANGTYTTSAYHDIDVLLDTTGAQWKLTYEVDNVAVGTTFTFTTNPSIGNIGFGSNKLNGSVAEFSLTAVPEPSALVLAGLSLMGLIGVARRKK